MSPLDWDLAPILFLLPSVDWNRPHTIVNWFRWLDRDRFRPSLITTEPSSNSALSEILPYANEVWPLPELTVGEHFPKFILDFVSTRRVRVVDITDSRLGFDLLPDLRSLPDPPTVVVHLDAEDGDGHCHAPYVAARYADLVDVFATPSGQFAADLMKDYRLPRWQSRVIEGGAGGELAGQAHGKLYEELLARRSEDRKPPNGVLGQAKPVRFSTRPAREKPLVSAVVGCSNQGRHLPECLESITRQSYAALETVVVDDASTDAETLALLERVEQDPRATLVRLTRESGPGASRNAGVSRARGRYLLILDADDRLLPQAVERLVEQLQAAGERVGFIYPSLHYAGKPRDSVQAPDYNLYALLQENFCRGGLLIDRAVFEAGLRYAEEPGSVSEDWDFALALAEHGVYGESADEKTLIRRERGSSWAGKNWDVEIEPTEPGTNQNGAARAAVEKRHRGLYGAAREIKARWSPALSVIALEEARAETAARLGRRLRRQSCRDGELLLRFSSELEGESRGNLRRIPPALAASPADALADGLAAARGRYILVTNGTGWDLLEDFAFVEKVLRTFNWQKGLGAIAFTDVAGCFPFQLVSVEDRVPLEPHAVVWSLTPEGALPADVRIGPEDPVSAVARALDQAVQTEWRHFSQNGGGARASEGSSVQISVSLGGVSEARPGARAERRSRLRASPALPAAPARFLPGFASGSTWMPPGMQLLCRHVDSGSGRRVVTNSRQPPPDHVFEHVLGLVRRSRVRGTALLEALEAEDGVHYRAVGPDEDDADRAQVLGHIELSDFPMLDRLELALDPATEERVLVCGEDDPLAGTTKALATLGWIERFPIKPWRPAPLEAEVE